MIIFFVFYKIVCNSIMPSFLQARCQRRQPQHQHQHHHQHQHQHQQQQQDQKKPDLTFYFSVDTKLPTTSFARFNIDDSNKGIINQLQIVNCDLTDKIPTDKNNYKKIGIGIGDHVNFGIPITSNVDSFVGTMRNVSFIFNSNNNSSSVDSLSIYGAYQVKINSQGYFMVDENTTLVFDIVAGMGKYLGARGKVEIRSPSQFQRRADVYFDK